MTIGILLAAGKGSRLAPLTLETPKPLLPIAGSTLIERNMDRALDIVDAFVIVVGWLGDKIHAHIGPMYRGKLVIYARQANPSGGTLDALRSAIKAADAVHPGADFLVMNSDDLHGPDIFEQLGKDIKEDPDHALIGAKILEDRERLKNFGVIEVVHGNIFSHIVEKPQEFISELVNIGLYYFPAKVREFVPDTSLNPGKEEYLTDHLLNPYCAKFPVRVLSTEDLWLPVNGHAEYDEAKRVLGK